MQTGSTKNSVAGFSAVVYGVTVFLGAFLLFQLQPLFGKYLLPWFGGSPEIWTTCMLFFQVCLLGGYAYAHLLVSRFGVKVQATVHAALLAAAILVLPVVPEASLAPSGTENPILQILLICAVSIGLPFFVLSATGPLIQGWFCRILPGRVPYRLYSISNAGSMLALLSYPFFIEPIFTRKEQAYGWGYGLVGFGVVCCLCAVLLWKFGTNIGTDGEDTISEEKTTGKAKFFWIALPMAASVELLAVTSKITQDIAVVPFLWILPLVIYLLSFIICFHHQRWYNRGIFQVLFVVSIGAVIAARINEAAFGIGLLISIYSFMLFCCCMVCHGELYRLRPGARSLTGYYLSISIGGALGGFAVTVVAPFVFNDYHELYFGFLGCVLLLLWVDERGAKRFGNRRIVWTILIAIAASVAIFVPAKSGTADRKMVQSRRNFFGVLKLWEESAGDAYEHKFVLQHGTTFHGLQFTHPKRALKPTAYYNEDSGIGLVMKSVEGMADRKIGIVGLGVGTIATYGKAGDEMVFYEINPEVEVVARENFSYLSCCKTGVDVQIGDGRNLLERDVDKRFDVLALDAFSSDSVPLHLLTTDAFEIYLSRIKDDGIIAIHVSTIHLDLHSVIFRLAEHFGLESALVVSQESDSAGVFSSDWILLARDGDIFNAEAFAGKIEFDYARRKDVDLWTDDRVNLPQIIKAAR